MLKKFGFRHAYSIIVNMMFLNQTFVESNSVLKYEILEWASSQTCIKLTVKVIIDAPEQETVLCELVW